MQHANSNLMVYVPSAASRALRGRCSVPIPDVLLARRCGALRRRAAHHATACTCSPRTMSRTLRSLFQAVTSALPARRFPALPDAYKAVRRNGSSAVRWNAYGITMRITERWRGRWTLPSRRAFAAAGSWRSGSSEVPLLLNWSFVAFGDALAASRARLIVVVL